MAMATAESSLRGSTAIVTGAGRGFGLAIASALASVGVEVVGVGRSAGGLVAVVGDAADPTLAAQLLKRHKPRTVVLAAGATPAMLPLQEQTWETFSRTWEVDVRQAFEWCSAALLQPLPPGSTVICFSSGAAIQGSPLSGGYAGAKGTVRFIATYAAQEAARSNLELRFTSVLPRLTPATALGMDAVRAYAARAGVGVTGFLEAFGPVASVESIAADVLTLATDSRYTEPAYALAPTGGLLPL